MASFAGSEPPVLDGFFRAIVNPQPDQPIRDAEPQLIFATQQAANAFDRFHLTC